MTDEHFDVLIVGAGLSGIGAAVHLATRCPGKSFALIEARAVSGGTWDLFRYPGIRSDSDMFTLGYAFKPWTGSKSIADGPSILAYIRETAREHGIDRKIRYDTRMVRASWSSQEARWTVQTERSAGGGGQRITCNFLLMCAGYYSYEQGYTPELPGIAHFTGRIIHPQSWTDDIDVTGKRVVVIGSGATAVTLVPELAKTAAHVTVLQRSPTYVVAWPDEDAVANWLRRHFPQKTAYRLTRLKNVLRSMYFFRLAKKRPDAVKDRILTGVRAALGPDYDVGKHFTPRYKPWDQRVCLDANAGIFRSIRDGKTTIATDEIATFKPSGILLKSGEEIAADVVVTATGLLLQQMGGAKLEVDGRAVQPSELMAYKGAMFSGLPNLVSVFGYTNASWTLKADLVCDWTCRVLQHMDSNGYAYCVPDKPAPDVEPRPWVDFTSGYIARMADKLPHQGSRRPWRLYQNYALDRFTLKYGRIDDGVLLFKTAPLQAGPRPTPQERAPETAA